MTDDVMVIRFRGKDIIGFIQAIDNKVVTMNNPHFISYNPSSASLITVPYCIFTDEETFTFDVTNIDFINPARPDVAKGFVNSLSEVTNHIARSDILH